MNAATMVGQSKNPFQSEIDAVAELVDFFRFNVKYMTEIMAQHSRGLNVSRSGNPLPQYPRDYTKIQSVSRLGILVARPYSAL